jgi:hypothetical protein
MNALAGALKLAAGGMPVFPCLADKRPATPNGFKDATCDPQAVRQMWARHPGQLIGVPTGAASGIDVLDLDPRHGGERWWLAHAHRLPQTRTYRTRSGGLHVVFQHAEPVRNTAGKIGPGVDTRGEGGYVIAWWMHGCRMVEAPIAPWPTWLLERLLAKQEPPPPPRRQHPPADPADAAQRIAARVLNRLAGAPAGQRHYTLRAASYTLGGLLDRLPWSEAEVHHRLHDAVQAAGAEDLNNADRTIAWGMVRGRAAPLTLGERRE